MKVNKELSEKYKGLHIYNSENKQFPYYVLEWDECFTEEEIGQHWNEEMDFANINTEHEITCCPYCGSTNFEWMGDVAWSEDDKPYCCHNCDRWFGEDEVIEVEEDRAAKML